MNRACFNVTLLLVSLDRKLESTNYIIIVPNHAISRHGNIKLIFEFAIERVTETTANGFEFSDGVTG